jgi:hypothetical protein
VPAAASFLCPQCGAPCEETSKFCAGCGFPVHQAREKMEDPLIGQTLPGGHVVLELIDVGGMGRVYRAEQRMLGRTVAVKIIHPHLLGDETVEARFITEARAASQLNHPNSVSVFDFGKSDGRFYLVMEYLRGRDLAVVARDEGPFEVSRIVNVMSQVLAALEEAHHLGIVHRDLKPENIVLQSLRSGGDFVKVIDFGLARVREEAHARRITNPGMVCGTPQYMAPEQARGDVVDARTDLYACGVLLYELLTGALPFEAPSPNEVVAMQLNDAPPDPRDLAPERDFSPAVVDLLMRALAKMPTERFQSAAEFSEVMQLALLGAPASRSRPSSEHVRCPKCNALVERSQKFCGECGGPMRRAHPTPAPAAPGPRVPILPRVDLGDLHVGQLPGFELMGREQDLVWLRSCRDGLGSALGAYRLSGKPGVGRTRLLAEFATEMSAAGDLVVSVGPDPWRADVGYATLRDAVTALAGLPADGGDGAQWAGSSPEARAGLGEIFGHATRSLPDAERRWSDTPPIYLKRNNRRALAAEALRWAFACAQHRAGGRSVVVIVDDLDAVDGASRQALGDVVAEPPFGSALLLVAHEQGFDPEWEQVGERVLGGLAPHQAAPILDSGPPSLPPRLVPGSGGAGAQILPMYLEQVVRFSNEGGDDPPGGLADLLAVRIERLPADARRVLQAIAVLSDGVAGAELAPMVPDVPEVERLLRKLEHAGFIERRNGTVATSHPFIRDVTLSSIPAEVRRRLHGRARQVASLEHGPMPLEAHALHAFHAQESFDALMLLEQVAERAAERSDNWGSVRALRLGLDLARREMSRGEIDDPLGAILLFSCKLGDVLALAGRLWDADGVLREALDLGGPRAAARPRILASLAQVSHERGRDEAANGYLDEALAIAAERGRLDLIAYYQRLRQLWSEEPRTSR